MTMNIEKRTIFQLFSSGLSFMKLFLKRPSSIKANFNLAHEMKLLNDRKEFKSAIELFEKHSKNNNKALSNFVATQAIKAFAGVKDLDRGSMIHNQIRSVKNIDSYVVASLINMYAECGEPVKAQSLFDEVKHKTEAIYAAMMKVHIKNNQANRSIDLFRKIEHPNEMTTILLLKACAELGTSKELQLVRKCTEDMPKQFLSNPRLFTALLDALMKCGDVKYAETLFRQLKEKTQHSYGAMIKGYIVNGLPQKALDLFHEVQAPGEITVVLLFNACAQLRTNEALNTIKMVSERMPPKFLLNEHVFTSFLDALMKCGDVEYAESLFRASRENSFHSYGAMMKGYIENKMPQKAIDLFLELKTPKEAQITLFFNACAKLQTEEALRLAKHFSERMPKSYFSNQHVFTSFLDALIKCNDIDYAMLIFDKSNHKSSTAYGVMILGLANEDNPENALKLFNQMKMNHVEKNIVSYLGAIKAVSRLCDLSMAQWIIKQIPESAMIHYRIQTALIDLWGKVGCVNKAKEIFDKMNEFDEVTYAAMVNAYCLNGMGGQAIELFRRIPQQRLDETIYICTLNACSHSGLISEARDIFQSIQMKTTHVYCTMIDCLSRSACFADAQELIDAYERSHPPNVVMYMALLSGARNANNTSLSENIYDKLKKLFPQQEDRIVSGAILLANTYASSGEIGKALEVRQELVKSGMKKKVGMTRTVIDGQIYTFKAHDRSHHRSDEIYAELERISEELLKHGHQYDASWITRSLNQDETVASVLCGHSERLAIAWNFVANPNASRIQLSKNLRVCGDCHRSTKLIAAIRQCEIIVRDANRVHHFYKNGQCSCNDYF